MYEFHVTKSLNITAGSKTYNGLAIAPCNVPVTKKGVTAIPCGVDKYNSYRKSVHSYRRPARKIPNL